MKKNELLAAVAKKANVSQLEANSVIEALSDVIVERCVKSGDEINIPNLGKFKQKVNAAREGINPLTGKKMKYKETRNLRFTPASSIKITIE